MINILINTGFKVQLLILSILGFVSSFAFAPYYQVWILCISISMLAFFVFYSQSYKNSFLLGYFFGFWFFVGGLYWIANALFIDINSYIYLIPIAIIVIPAILAFYISILSLTLHYFNNRSSSHFVILFICLWVLFEVLRTYCFTGFPWLSIGYSLMFSDYLIQSASIFGIFGLSFIVLGCSCVPFLLFHPRKANFVIAGLFVCLVILNSIFGIYRLRNPTEYSDKSISIIQPNISQVDKMNPQKVADNLHRLSMLTMQPRSYISKSSYIIWPETALGHYYKVPVVKEIIGNILPEGHYLITGVDRMYGNKIYNSVVAFNHKGNIIAHYDKFHLVPFGEYLPFRKLFPRYMHNISNGLIDFESGDGPHTIHLDSMPSFSPLICYESLFPKDIIDSKIRPKILINFTNDAWYGNTSGPYQHFDMTRLRAVEYGIPMIRASNTGISAIIDSYGRTLSYLSLNTSGVIQKKIPLPLKSISIFSKYGSTIVILLTIIIAGVCLLTVRR